MYLDNVAWSQIFKVSVPVPEKRKTEVLVSESSDLPSFPVLANKRAIKKHISESGMPSDAILMGLNDDAVLLRAMCKSVPWH